MPTAAAPRAWYRTLYFQVIVAVVVGVLLGWRYPELGKALLLAILAAFAISALGERREPILQTIETVGQIFFGIMRLIVKLAPLGALGAMAFTVGSYGLSALGRLAFLMGGFYLTAGLFVV